MLALAAIFALERNPQDLVGEVVVDPVWRLGQKAYRADACLFVKFTIGCGQRIFTVIDPALGHLPWRVDFGGVRAGGENAPGQENLPAVVEECDTDAVAIGHLRTIGRRVHCVASMEERALTGTRRYSS